MTTEATKGGVLMYVNEGINCKPREDLNMHKPKELESYFIEVINDDCKNSIIGTIYRHPCMERNQFIDEYMKPLNDELHADQQRCRTCDPELRKKKCAFIAVAKWTIEGRKAIRHY